MEILGKSEINFCESQYEVQVSEGLSYRESNVGKTQLCLFRMKQLIRKVCCWNFHKKLFQSLQDTPEIDLAVYQEMWFPVAVVAGVTVILIFLAIVCLVSHSIPNLLSYCSSICR